MDRFDAMQVFACREFLYRFVRRFAGAVTSTGLDAQRVWTSTEIGGLECRNVFK